MNNNSNRFARPKRTAVLNARVEPECREALEAYARKHGYSLADALFRLIKTYLIKQ
ncbi:hypothetical protein FHY11_000342 [Xanthomonas arboricola]|uniref:hypothetical protein n=1 Tax=Xanthomonas euroxanthea TaxID=2259622 RepID=UPI00141B4244|nr:hypothetical protein [Xanthomonas euroxanthea]NIK06876.1 hypothetical protein [Xanthomonas euroxanthea]